MRVVYALGDAVVEHIRVHAGSHWPADDPFVRRHPEHFSDDPRVGLNSTAPLREETPIEDMTAEPGARRAVRVPRETRG